jgi:hypothetical protein
VTGFLAINACLYLFEHGGEVMAVENRVWVWTGVLASLLFVGCGGDGLSRVKVEGTVTAENGPVANAVVQFLPMDGTEGEGAIGQADAQGKFTLVSSRRQDAGIPPGKYRVRVLQMIDADGTVLPGDAIQADFPMAREGVPAPYSTMDSPVEVTISPQDKEVKIDLPVQTLGK